MYILLHGSVLSNPSQPPETTEGVGKDHLWVIYKDVQLQTICASEETRIKLNSPKQGSGYTNYGISIRYNILQSLKIIL